ncbi:hypothetical protein B0H34DRAFT_680397 [Crassisporium funariophilum]|nr:hypothetical protein B0H34DRAFT_680397 [Crassisporium funariophilum]
MAPQITSLSSFNTFEPWTPSVPSQSSKIDTTLDISNTVLGTLRNIGSLSGLPYLGETAGLALRILTIVQDIRTNEDSFKELAKDACGLVYAVVIQCQRILEEGGVIPIRMESGIHELMQNLCEIEKFAQKKLKRNGFKRMINHSRDVTEVERYRVMLRQSLDIFGVQSHVTIHQNLEEILRTIKKQASEDQVSRLQREAEHRATQEQRFIEQEVAKLEEMDREEERRRISREHQAVILEIEILKKRAANANRRKAEQEIQAAEHARIEQERPLSPPAMEGWQNSQTLPQVSQLPPVFYPSSPASGGPTHPHQGAYQHSPFPHATPTPGYIDIVALTASARQMAYLGFQPLCGSGTVSNVNISNIGNDNSVNKVYRKSRRIGIS